MTDDPLSSFHPAQREASRTSPARASDVRRRPGAALLEPVPLLGILLLVLNDHVFKVHFPGVLTGKLSDFAGLVFFPLLVQSFAELGARATGSKQLEHAVTSLRATSICCAVTALTFTLVKTWYPASEGYRVGLGAIRSCMRALLVADAPFRRVSLIADATDLVALPATYLAYWSARRSSRRR